MRAGTWSAAASTRSTAKANRAPSGPLCGRSSTMPTSRTSTPSAAGASASARRTSARHAAQPKPSAHPPSTSARRHRCMAQTRGGRGAPAPRFAPAASMRPHQAASATASPAASVIAGDHAGRTGSRWSAAAPQANAASIAATGRFMAIADRAENGTRHGHGSAAARAIGHSAEHGVTCATPAASACSGKRRSCARPPCA